MSRAELERTDAKALHFTFPGACLSMGQSRVPLACLAALNCRMARHMPKSNQNRSRQGREPKDSRALGQGQTVQTFPSAYTKYYLLAVA